MKNCYRAVSKGQDLNQSKTCLKSKKPSQDIERTSEKTFSEAKLECNAQDQGCYSKKKLRQNQMLLPMAEEMAALQPSPPGGSN